MKAGNPKEQHKENRTHNLRARGAVVELLRFLEHGPEGSLFEAFVAGAEHVHQEGLVAHLARDGAEGQEKKKSRVWERKTATQASSARRPRPHLHVGAELTVSADLWFTATLIDQSQAASFQKYTGLAGGLGSWPTPLQLICGAQWRTL